MSDLVGAAGAAFRSVAIGARNFTHGFMVFSDLCGSTDLASRDLQAGAALQAAHEAVCAGLAGLGLESPHFKSLGDGVMMEIRDATAACQIALQLIEVAEELRARAARKQLASEFTGFNVKVVVASGEFLPAPESQRWLGLLPTKAARLASYARPGQVWIDSMVADAISAHLAVMGAEFDDKPIRGAAFQVPLKGFHGRHFAIHELRRLKQPSSVKADEKEKELLLTWPDVTGALRGLLPQIIAKGPPGRVVGIGRSGAILGGIIAGNLPRAGGHVPIDVCERTQPQVGAERVISTVTEPPETYLDRAIQSESRAPTQVWDPAPVLLVIGEAKTNGSFHSAQAWLNRRGITEIKTLALVKGREARPDFFSFEAQNAWLPWQFSPGYDLDWPTYQVL